MNSGPPHGPMGLVQVPFYVLWSDYLLLAFLHLIALIALGMWLWRLKAQNKARREEPTSEQLQWLALNQDLDQLEASLRPESWDPGVFALRLSASVRQALAHACGLSAISQTLPELRKSLSQTTTLPAEMKDHVLAFFAWAEEVQFAGQREIPRDLAAHWLVCARSWLAQWERDKG